MSETLSCLSNQACPYQYTCIQQLCQHNPLFPLSQYTVFVYLLIPFFLALANIGGVSGGYLKVPLFMDMLNYQERIATFYTYPLILGGGMANFFLLVPQRHPNYDRPLVDYNIVNVLLPCVIFGSTIGVICNLIVPELIMDILVMVVFSFIAYLFAIKYKQYRISNKIKSGQLSKPLTSKPRYFKRSNSTPRKQVELTYIQEVQETESQVFTQKNVELQVILEQDKGFKIKSILKTFLIFIFFELLSLLIQGKLYHFDLCQSVFILLFFGFIGVFVAYLIIYYHYQKPRYAHYDKIQYKYEVDLSNRKNYIMLTFGGTMAGFCTGLIAAGCGHIMILFMLSLNIHPKVASATSGYQVMFIGASSTIQALIQGSLQLQPFLFFLLLSLIGSFALSIIAYRYFDKMPDKGEGKIIIILIMLSVISIVGVIPNIIITKNYYGWQYLMSITGFGC